ncbi:hypothetical protein HER10_EVM0005453 [Colletotrichum scovillei]|uniref:F-box domain-containing protein n=1 Tax=Colletotrichum scovillei TaxID=1209932 RepID=A0A9P7QUP4_9PEZI|nr:uncharacterized protein HER10_EVM0005453 [Colletotrichum scovillei]KAF4780983.1 hypothetical protein HER10_EVM0005453 [Colletotrichum scovillei]KAG7039266.1 hypothetical protein JMJ78_0005061 [Colletotrichum scovillei]KAG7041448.1 hypothetical protein JMJ77_0003554 [Colletotrichum scovillei]KAG7061477.1 hypothetical protein JMJ76_0001041 [Colletotrichum scovillei]
MASISSLPPEMLGEIAACFQDDSPLNAHNDWTADQKTLAILSRVSKSFQYAAQPLLYRNIYLAVRDPVGINILSLIKVLYHRQDLRSKVNKVQIHFEKAFSCHLERTTDDVKNLHDMAWNMDQTNLCRALYWSTKGSWLYNNVLSSLLFNQLQGVSQVMITGLDGPDITDDYGEFDHFENAWSVLPYLWIAPSETPEALLPNLAFLRLDAHVITIPGSLEFHLLARLAPNLESISGCRFESVPAAAFNGFKKLKHLSLVDAPLEHECFPNEEPLLGIPPGLHSFHYIVCDRSRDELYISPMKARQALAQHSDTLISISLQFSLDREMEDEWFDTFEMFKNLEHLSVNPSDFAMKFYNGLGPNAFITSLPRSLRSLTLLSQDHLEYQDIEWLADALQHGDFENLESFTIYVHDKDSDSFYTNLGETWRGIEKPEVEEEDAFFRVTVISETTSRELWCYW